MKVENLGFFRELPHGDPQGPSLRDALGRGEVDLCDRIADYLATGAVLASTGARVFDVLKDGTVDAGRLAIQTDGRWVWPADLSYYVREYNVQLPADFLDWARSVEWVAPQLSHDELVQIEKQLFPEGSTG